MKKKDLLALIERALNVEEEAVQSFAKHVSAAVEWCGCTDAENKKVRNILNTLAQESRQHKGILENLRDNILKNKGDNL